MRKEFGTLFTASVNNFFPWFPIQFLLFECKLSFRPDVMHISCIKGLLKTMVKSPACHRTSSDTVVTFYPTRLVDLFGQNTPMPIRTPKKMVFAQRPASTIRRREYLAGRVAPGSGAVCCDLKIVVGTPIYVGSFFYRWLNRWTDHNCGLGGCAIQQLDPTSWYFKSINWGCCSQ